ncbi:MAG: glycoside hydrolase family 32 protein [Ruminococcus sp.]|nr:glycoside hydrolase family 32 protein [Ruminococcus sp.]
MMNDLRQSLHLEPLKGWLNDPNGLCFFKGEYHVYFQYAPDRADGGGRKCWGHFKSPDLRKWQFTGTVLFPDTPDDRNGVYSGCGLVKGGKLYLFYTGNVMEEGDHDYTTSGRGANVILVTTEDGHTMSEKKTLLRSSDYPDYCSCHVRDPKVWEEDGRYHMVLGARTLDDKGCVLFYASDDLENWEFEEEVRTPGLGYMWECPDVFTLGTHKFLSISPQGAAAEKYRFQNVYSSGCLDLDTGVYTEWDNGFDFYAPQSFEAPDGRRLFIGWMGIGDIPYSNPTVGLGWQHCLTLPCELTVREDGKILRSPARELTELRREQQTVTDGRSFDTQLPFELTGDTEKEFSVVLANVFTLVYSGGEVRLRFLGNAGCGRTVRYARLPECRDIRIIADKTSAEIFLNCGETVLSTRMYPADTQVRLITEGITGTLFTLEGIEVSYDG